MRSGSFRKPRPLLAFDCGSQSTSNVFTSAAEIEAARLMAVVVLPTPPFWLATAMMRPMIFEEKARAKNSANALVKSIPHFFGGPNVPRGTSPLQKAPKGGSPFSGGLFCWEFHVEHSPRGYTLCLN